jgi:hypothetical protein
MELRPASPTRIWMDNSINKNPYRCLPLTMANSYGWELLSKSEVIAEWNGGQGMDDVKITRVSGTCFPTSHFGEGVITWHTGYLFRTESPYGLYVTGSPNEPIHNITCLSGIVETDWLPFTFTMNWKFTAPGKVHIKQGDVIAHVFPIDVRIFEEITSAEIAPISSNSDLNKEFKEWSESRNSFNKSPRKHTEWQKNYFKGVDLKGNKSEGHKTNPNVPNFFPASPEPPAN